MRWLWIVPLGLVAVLTLVALAGSFVPRRHTASRRVRLRRPVEVVFPILVDFAAAPAWRSAVRSVDLLPVRDGKPSFRETGPNGALTYVVDEMVPSSRLVTRIVDNSAFGGTWTFELASEGSACVVSITERGEVYNPIFRLMGRLFFSPTATLETYLVDLGRKLGETVRPEP